MSREQKAAIHAMIGSYIGLSTGAKVIGAEVSDTGDATGGPPGAAGAHPHNGPIMLGKNGH
jgi:hypothetical protein